MYKIKMNHQKQKYTAPSHIISLNEKIQCFELANHECCQNLVGIAVDGKIVLGVVRFPEETENEIFEWHQLKEISHETRCHAISFAPDTSLAVLPKVVKFCAAGADYNLRIFRSSLQDRDTVLVVKGHTNYINDVAWDPEGRFIATVSDDHTCCVWTDQDDCESRTVFQLRSAGMSVRWHPEDTEKILVAEKRGCIYMYNVLSQQTVLSLETLKTPLTSADWSLFNRLHVVALAGGDIFMWNIRKPSRPQEVKSIHEDGGQVVRFAPNSDSAVASIGRPGTTLKVTQFKSQISQIEADLKLFGGLDWHYRLPYVAAASDRKLCFWRVLVK